MSSMEIMKVNRYTYMGQKGYDMDVSSRKMNHFKFIWQNLHQCSEWIIRQPWKPCLLILFFSKFLLIHLVASKISLDKLTGQIYEAFISRMYNINLHVYQPIFRRGAGFVRVVFFLSNFLDNHVLGAGFMEVVSTSNCPTDKNSSNHKQATLNLI